MAETETQPLVPDVPENVGWVLKCVAIFIGGFTLWSAGPGIATDHVRLTMFLLAVWTFVFLSHDIRRRFRRPVFPPAGVVLGLVSAALLAWLSTMASALFAGETLAVTLAIVAALVFITTFFFKEASNVALAAMGVLVLCYTYFNYLELVNRAGAWTDADLFVAGTATLISLEAARRGLGLAIPVIAGLAMIYAYFGQYMPYDIAHRGVSLDRMLNYILYSQEGVFGIMTSVMANYVFVFILLGAFMTKSGMGRFFIEFPMSIAGRSAGGPAKVAVFSSGIFGSISGSSLANIVSTGTFTIPLMKRVGFRPAVAGAIENSASLGGQLLPPVMGAGVFVMAEITGIAYTEIIAVALAPALLYFAALILIVHFEAKRNGIGGVPEDETMRPATVMREGWFHILPFAVLVASLVAGYSPDRSALASILTILTINWIRFGLARMNGTTLPDTFLGISGIAEAMTDGAKNAVAIGGIAAAIGIIVGMIALTGFGLKMGLLIVGATDGSLFITLLLIALTSLILGMALPITAAYLVVVVIAAPALEHLGVPLIAAHMIVFWLSQDSNITPPVCLGAFVAASIAKAGPWQTAWLSFRFAKMLYVMPILFAYTPILFTGSMQMALWTITTATLGTVAFTAWTMGYLRNTITRATSPIMAIIALALFFPAELNMSGVSGLVINIAGISALVVFIFLQGRQQIAQSAEKAT